MKYGERLRIAREHKGLSQDELVKISGVKQGTISKIERGDQNSSGFDAELSHALNIEAMWLKKGLADFAPDWLAPDSNKNSNLKPIEGSNVKRIEKNYGKVPLISWVQAGSWCEAHDPYPSGYAEEWLDCPINHSTGTYALAVTGDSMTSPHAGAESYTEGMIIFCDPALEPRSGDKVIAKLIESNEVTFKIYRVDGGKSWLMPLNPLYDKIEMTEGMHICGVVIFAGFNTRR